MEFSCDSIPFPSPEDQLNPCVAVLLLSTLDSWSPYGRVLFFRPFLFIKRLQSCQATILDNKWSSKLPIPLKMKYKAGHEKADFADRLPLTSHFSR